MSDLNLELTLEQQLEIEKFKRYIANLSRQDLEQETLGIAKLKFAYLNAYKSVCKKDIL